MKPSEVDVGVVVTTLNAECQLRACLEPITRSLIHPKILVVDSSSSDQTVECARSMGAEVTIVPRRSFNHGDTREFARRLLGTRIVVFMTQDAQPVDASFLERLISPLQRGEAAVSYARQIPRVGAGTIEAFPRGFNYPDVSNMRSIGDIEALGVYTFFCSNSCAAYVSGALDEIGGFRHVLTAEDTFAVARLLRRGYRIAYVADAVVRHSHNHSLIEEFRRHFDTGYVRHCHRDLLCGLSDERRGSRYARAFLTELWWKSPWAMGKGAAVLLTKYLGYRTGRHADGLPLWLRQRLSSLPNYWTSVPLPSTSARTRPRTETGSRAPGEVAPQPSQPVYQPGRSTRLTLFSEELTQVPQFKPSGITSSVPSGTDSELPLR